MKKKTTKPRVHVELSAFWGNDVDSTIKVSRRRWKNIQEGAEYEAYASSWYEGKRYSVGWHFSDGKVSIYGEDCEHVLDLPVDELFTQTITSG